MTEEQIDNLVDELYNDSSELRHFISESLEDADAETVDDLVEDLQSSKMDLREFVINTLVD